MPKNSVLKTILKIVLIRAFALAVALGSASVNAKPIAFADGTTIMHERNSNMLETQAFYAPAYWWSIGPGFIRLTSDDKKIQREITYLQANYLVKRWNMEDAQANIFTWGGIGTAKARGRNADFVGSRTTYRWGAQGDFETRRVYSSFKTDGYSGDKFTHRIDTLQLGLAPYEHDYDILATWLVFQARHYTGGIRDAISDDIRDGNARTSKIEKTAILRLFKGPLWVELGINQERKSQIMFMFNY